MLAQTWISVVRAILQGWESHGVVGECFMGRSIQQLRWQERVVRPPALSLLAANTLSWNREPRSNHENLTAQSREVAIDMGNMKLKNEIDMPS